MMNKTNCTADEIIRKGGLRGGRREGGGGGGGEGRW